MKNLAKLSAILLAMLMLISACAAALADGQMDIIVTEESEITHDLIAMSHDKDDPLAPLQSASRARVREKLGDTAGIGGVVTVMIKDGDPVDDLRRDYTSLEVKSKVGVEMMAFLHIVNGEEVTQMQLEAGVPLDKPKAIRVRYTAEAIEALKGVENASLIFVIKNLNSDAEDGSAPQLITRITMGSHSAASMSVRQYYAKGKSGGIDNDAMDVVPVEPDEQDTLDVIAAMSESENPVDVLTDASKSAIKAAFGDEAEINEVFTVQVVNYKDTMTDAFVRDFKQFPTPYAEGTEVMAIMRITTHPKKGEPRVKEFVLGASVPTEPNASNEGTVRVVYEPTHLAELDKDGFATMIIVNAPMAVEEEAAEEEAAETK